MIIEDRCSMMMNVKSHFQFFPKRKSVSLTSTFSV